MKQGIIIREATAADIPALAVLAEQLGYPTTVAEMQQRMDRILQQREYHTLVAEQDGIVCGMIGFCTCYAWEINDPYIRIQTLVIDTATRSSGAGKALVEACATKGKEIGAAYLSLNCGNKAAREAAHAFYPAIGFLHTSSGYIRHIV